MVRKGLRVEKIMGYKFPGIIRSVFRTGAGRTRCVVECEVPGCEGMLHIFNPDQLRSAPSRKSPGRGQPGASRTGRRTRAILAGEPPG